MFILSCIDIDVDRREAREEQVLVYTDNLQNYTAIRLNSYTATYTATSTSQEPIIDI